MGYEGLHLNCTHYGCYGHRSRKCTIVSAEDRSQPSNNLNLENTIVIVENIQGGGGEDSANQDGVIKLHGQSNNRPRMDNGF
ncbi:hypothetical protein SESBI_29813 [Sesbania bispinosa]|nr:hypothetical protein SESBI_29813 [Sesbania bispinosa]